MRKDKTNYVKTTKLAAQTTQMAHQLPDQSVTLISIGKISEYIHFMKTFNTIKYQNIFGMNQYSNIYSYQIKRNKFSLRAVQ